MNISTHMKQLSAPLIAVCLALAATGAAAQSLYSESNFRPLTADNKAYRVGDVLTVQIVESAAASANADTATRRSNDISAGLTRAHVAPIGVGIGTSGEFDGGGKTTRTGKLLAQLTVQVKQVLPNGDLQVAGEQLLLINDEQQRINVEGRVRPQDISENNVVLSSRLAAARITYVGDGELADRQKPAWWRQLLDWIGL
ncbi:MAG: flagellar basal body L-ring protein FlgH [Rhizobacter sp.]|nr:flagellar basal body L-ring protein FlgH [Rhizobacter sp.]